VAEEGNRSTSISTPLGVFPTTHWSAVAMAGHRSAPGAAVALEELCRAYWPPLYAYLRRQGHSPEESQDLTQEFFVRLLAKDYFNHANPVLGRFRTFLLTSLKNFLVSDWRRAHRLKRGGLAENVSWDAEAAEHTYMAEAADADTPEKAYERAWAVALMNRVMDRIGTEFTAEGKTDLFLRLRHFVQGSGGDTSYSAIASELGMSEGAIKVAVHRLRQRCREILREEIGHTVARPEDTDDELRHLLTIFSG
jgi:RNA polymerase sigma factor (sigma-70 family)